MEYTPSIEDLRKPHPDQGRIDSESARLLRSSAKSLGFADGWSPRTAANTGKRRRSREQTPLVNGAD
jgi:hypothetical protein